MLARTPAFNTTVGNTIPGYMVGPDQAAQQYVLGSQRFALESQGRKADQDFQSGQLSRELANRLQLAGVQNRGNANTARIAADASKFPSVLAQQRFDRLFPLLQQQLGNGQFNSSVGGQSGASPEITVRPVWDQSQVQQRVNQMRAGNDQAAAGQVQQQQQRLAGAGFSAKSPLLAELQARAQGQAMMANTQGENDLRWNAAQGNARQVLDTQVARSDQFADRMQEDIERRRVASGQFNALLASLASLA